jgi:hypothetical protein
MCLVILGPLFLAGSRDFAEPRSSLWTGMPRSAANNIRGRAVFLRLEELRDSLNDKSDRLPRSRTKLLPAMSDDLVWRL